MAYTLRPYRDDDAEALSEVILRAIASIGPHAYSPAQIDAWSARHPGPDRYRERHASGHLILVAADEDDRPVAYALLEPPENGAAHLDHLYCDPGHTRRGLANELLAQAEIEARKMGASRLYTEASELARPAFERAGYSVTHRRDFEIEHSGKAVPIHNYAMEKALD